MNQGLESYFKWASVFIFSSIVLFFVYKALNRDNSTTNILKVFKGVQAEGFEADAKGVVLLPPDLRSTSCNGNAYVTRQGNLLMVFIPVWFGKGGNVEGYLACSESLNQKTVNINYPQLINSGYSYGVGLNEVFINKHFRNHIYYIYNDLS